MPSRERVPVAGVALAPFSTLGVGGPARWFMRAGRLADVVAADAWCGDRGVELFVLGGGSNLVIADEGFDGLVLQMAMNGHERVPSGGGDVVLRAQAGTSWDAVVSASVADDLAGMECLSGIPGSVGGTPVQNVGAYGQEVAGTLDHVTAFDRRARQVVTLAAADCGFGYRTSRFKGEDAGRFVISEVAFRLRRDRPAAAYPDVQRYMDTHRISEPSVADLRRAVLEIRRGKGMVIDPGDPDTRSVGSFFMNPVVAADVPERVASRAGAMPPSFPQPDGRIKIPAAWLIERAGLAKGFTDGRVGISTKHPLAIVNRGGATARDVLRLAGRIKRQVGDRYGVWLRPEPIFVGFLADPDVAFLQNTDDSCRHY